MDERAKLRLAAILMRHGQLTAPQQNFASPTSPPASMPQQGVTVPAAPPQLPPFQIPGMTGLAGGPLAMPPPQQPAVTMPPVTVSASPLPPDPVAQVPSGGQGFGGPEPAPGSVRSDVITALRQMAQQGRLPEQWKGAFANQYGEPT